MEISLIIHVLIVDIILYEFQVNFGPKAFMPGQFVHTNEIMVLLGDNWFVERSAKQAREIVDRRLQGGDIEINICLLGNCKVQCEHWVYNSRSSSIAATFCEYLQ